MFLINWILKKTDDRKNRKAKTDEAIFLTDMLKGYLKWKGKNENYAESYRVALNAFTAK